MPLAAPGQTRAHGMPLSEARLDWSSRRAIGCSLGAGFAYSCFCEQSKKKAEASLALVIHLSGNIPCQAGVLFLF